MADKADKEVEVYPPENYQDKYDTSTKEGYQSATYYAMMDEMKNNTSGELAKEVRREKEPSSNYSQNSDIW